MKVLIDECLPRKLKRALTGHDCQTAPESGLAGLKNGELLDRSELMGFEVFITLDRGVEYQQRLEDRKLGVLLIRSKSSRLQDLLPKVPDILRTLDRISPGQLIKVGDLD
ncbi:MAG TPA: DUF5615 family PIN-like protein [Terriglobales bacterium]|nr:DUF5615 family PIN-like protein [Terriglobales bacterium]